MTVESFALPTRLASIAPSQIRENMRIASKVGAINLAQGRPDFPTAPQIKMAAIAAIAQDHNQYSVTWGLEELRHAIADDLGRRAGVQPDPEREVTVTCGVTEGIVAAMLSLIEPGDEVIILEPAHENYVPAIRFAGGEPRFVTLRPPDFALPDDALRAAVGPKTRAILLNTPHNPSGHVFTADELARIFALADEHGLFVVTDEIYDHLTYEPHRHVAPASVAPDPTRVITAGGISKIYAATGWRLGYVVASPDVSAAIRTVHDYLTICAPTPFQHAALTALALPPSYYDDLRADFRARRDQLMAILRSHGFVPHEPQGAYYLLAEYDRWSQAPSAEFTRFLIEKARIATVPGSALYYGDPDLGDRLIRFAFAKTEAVLDEVDKHLAACHAGPSG